MAAAPEGEGLFADPEPFSPSIFLDLPPTPRPDGNGEVPASSDDLVLPFITRILMEEDINDQFFYQFPDHPVLLQAQEPYAQILSDAATARTNSTATVSPATVLPSSSDDSVQLLLSPPYPIRNFMASPATVSAPSSCPHKMVAARSWSRVRRS